MGRARYLVPPALLAGRLAAAANEEEAAPDPTVPPPSTWPGVASVIALFSGPRSHVGGRPHWGSSVEDLSRAGGWVGVYFGGTLERWLNYVGPGHRYHHPGGGGRRVLLTSMSVSAIVDGVADRGGCRSCRPCSGPASTPTRQARAELRPEAARSRRGPSRGRGRGQGTRPGSRTSRLRCRHPDRRSRPAPSQRRDLHRSPHPRVPIPPPSRRAPTPTFGAAA